MNDMVGFAVERAVQIYGDKELFTAASFNEAISDIAGVSCTLDGRVVRAILTGRPDVQPLGEGMFRKKKARTT